MQSKREILKKLLEQYPHLKRFSNFGWEEIVNHNDVATRDLVGQMKRDKHKPFAFMSFRKENGEIFEKMIHGYVFEGGKLLICLVIKEKNESIIYFINAMKHEEFLGSEISKNFAKLNKEKLKTMLDAKIEKHYTLKIKVVTKKAIRNILFAIVWDADKIDWPIAYFRHKYARTPVTN